MTFALTPALISSAPLDFANAGDVLKLYYKASSALDIQFDVDPATLKLFLESTRQRAVAFNWMMMLSIQKNHRAYNMIDEYGSLTYDDILQHALTYNGLNVRHAQNSIQVFNCLSSSLTEAGRTRVFLEAH